MGLSRNVTSIGTTGIVFSSIWPKRWSYKFTSVSLLSKFYPFIWRFKKSSKMPVQSKQHHKIDLPNSMMLSIQHSQLLALISWTERDRSEMVLFLRMYTWYKNNIISFFKYFRVAFKWQTKCQSSSHLLQHVKINKWEMQELQQFPSINGC